MSDLISLACNNCGAPLQVDQSTLDDAFVAVGDGETFIFIGSSSSHQTLTCPHCGSVFQRKDEVKRHSGNDGSVATIKGDGGVIAQGHGAVAAGHGGVAIGGTVHGSFIVTDDSKYVIKRMSRD